MTNATWFVYPTTVTDNYNDSGNWSPTYGPSGPPTAGDTGFFGFSTVTDISIASDSDVGGWTLVSGASQYGFTVLGAHLRFFGTGVTVNGGSAYIGIVLTPGHSASVEFLNNSSAGKAYIYVDLGAVVRFSDVSSAGNATI